MTTERRESLVARTAWAPDQLWIVGAGLGPGAGALAREQGVRCFVTRGADIVEV